MRNTSLKIKTTGTTMTMTDEGTAATAAAAARDLEVAQDPLHILTSHRRIPSLLNMDRTPYMVVFRKENTMAGQEVVMITATHLVPGDQVEGGVKARAAADTADHRQAAQAARMSMMTEDGTVGTAETAAIVDLKT